MPSLTIIQVQKKVVQIISDFMELQRTKNKNQKLYVTITNVGLTDLIIYYYKTITPNKRLLLPEEFDSDCLCMIYTPAPGCIISIESEVSTKVFYNLNSEKGEPFFSRELYWKPLCMN